MLNFRGVLKQMLKVAQVEESTIHEYSGYSKISGSLLRLIIPRDYKLPIPLPGYNFFLGWFSCQTQGALAFEGSTECTDI